MDSRGNFYPGFTILQISTMDEGGAGQGGTFLTILLTIRSISRNSLLFLPFLGEFWMILHRIEYFIPIWGKPNSV